MDTVVLSKVSQANNKIGTNGDSPGTNTLFAQEKRNDYMTKTPKIAVGSTGNTTMTDVVNISGSGILTGISNATTGPSGSPGSNVTVILDGVTLINSVLMSYQSYYGASSLPCILKFSTSLQVQHKTSSGATSLTIVSYNLN